MCIFFFFFTLYHHWLGAHLPHLGRWLDLLLSIKGDGGMEIQQWRFDGWVPVNLGFRLA